MPESLTRQLLTSETSRHSVTHIGIVNVRKRLEILYPGKSSFEIISEPGYGTHITLGEGCYVNMNCNSRIYVKF